MPYISTFDRIVWLIESKDLEISSRPAAAVVPSLIFSSKNAFSNKQIEPLK